VMGLLLAGVLALAGAWATEKSGGQPSAQEAVTVALPGEPAANAKDQQPKPEEPAPSFAPGAVVTLAITLSSPEQWVLNYMVPLRLQFDEKALKTAPYSVAKPVWDFKFEHYIPRYTAEVPIKLNKGLPDGPPPVSLQVLCSICAASGEECTFAIEDLTVEVPVLAKAAPGAKNQALSKGTLNAKHKLSLP
jgi:hypothetical protein